MDADEQPSGIRFTTPLDNDFQWYNLYMRQFGTSAYPPPMPKNPSTTTAQYPTQRDLVALLMTDKTSRVAKQPPMAGAAQTGKSGGGGAQDGEGDDEDEDEDGSPSGRRRRRSTLDTLVDRLDADDLFSPNFFEFLKGPDGAPTEIFSVLLSPRSQRALNDQSIAAGSLWNQSAFGDSVFSPSGVSFGVGDSRDADMMMSTAANPGNPHGLSREVYNLQSEAWTLLLDNRALAWLQREASEKGTSASMVRLQLLQVATRSSFIHSGQLLQNLSRLPDPAVPPASTLLTTEQSFQRVYESFSPFFAILSPPAQVKRLRDQYHKAVRAQKAGRHGPVADLVGLPMFSQYATWREAYEHRKVWPRSPFSFFLMHDQSYNYAHVSAIFVLISVIKAHTHRHGPHCTDTSTSTIDLEMAGNLLSRARTARHQVAVQRQLCPYRVMEQMTENLIVAFENSEAKNALTMVLQVCQFLTDCALDQETAARFLDRSALLRQADFSVPGLNVSDSRFRQTGSNGAHRTTRAQTHGDGDQATNLANTPGEDALDRDGDAVKDDDADEAAKDAVGALEMLFSLRHFGEAEFNALFELNTWFLDAATANVRVPVDPSLCPPPRLLVHLGQAGGMAFTVNELSASSPAISSLSLGTTQTRQVASRSRGGASGSVSSSPRLPPLSPRSGGGAAVSPPPAGALNTSGGAGNNAFHQVPREHRYVPGRHQQYTAVGSLVQALIRYETRREQLLEAKATLQVTMRSAPIPHSSFSAASAVLDASTLEDTAGTATASRSPALSDNGAAESPHEDPGAAVGDDSVRDDPHAARRSRTATRVVEEVEAPAPHPGSPPLGGPTNTADAARTATGEESSGLSEATTVLAAPLIILSTYIRLHGAVWLKNLLDRLFNVLRRESVLLYVNRLDLESSTDPRALDQATGTSRRSSTLCASPLAQASAHTSAAPAAAGMNAQHLLDGFEARMERLEDLISQDIQYAMNEFLSALYGRRSATRLPQGVTTLLTQLCSTVHLHLLRDVLVSTHDGSEGRPGSAARRVAQHVHTLKLKRLAAKTMRNDIQATQSLDRLLMGVEQYRLAKFLLFDSWIIPALNNAVAFGYLPDNAPLHLRWNTDAFARYLKVLVNAPFTAAKARATQPFGSATPTPTPAAAFTPSPPSATPSPPLGGSKMRAKFPASAASGGAGRGTGVSSSPASPNPTGTSTSCARKRRSAKPSTVPPDEITLPPYITGIYDVSSGTLIRLHDPTVAVANLSPGTPGKLGASTALDSSRGALSGSAPMSSQDVSVTLPTMATSRTMIPQELQHKNSLSVRSPRRGGGAPRPAKTTFLCMDEAPWEALSPTLQSLNEVLGIVGYDPDDDEGLFRTQRGTVGVDDHCAMRVLDLFCQRASTEVTSNVVVSEFEVLPSVAAGCIEKIFDFVAGKHPLIEHAMETNALPSAFSFSPYLSALTGVLLHPMVASQALDNVYHNSPRFYDTLMRPVEDETMLSLISALIVDQGGVALVDCNALSPLLASQRADTAAMAGTRGDASQATVSTSPSLANRYDEEVRRLVRTKTFLTTGAQPRQPVTGHSYADQIQRMTAKAGPINPRTLLEAGRDRVVAEAGFVPTCFDLWWRSMTLAMTVKVITVLVECTAVQSDRFLEWCQHKIDINKREYRLLTEAFMRDKGGETLTSTADLRDLEAAVSATSAKRKTMYRGGQSENATGANKNKRRTKASAVNKKRKKKTKTTPAAAAKTAGNAT